MAFVCRICKSKFLVTNVIVEDVDGSIVSTICGHLFHRKCLEASITNQKLSHAMSGKGPFRRYCPAFGCGEEISENGIIDISRTREPRNLDKEETLDEEEDMEVRLSKRFQFLTSEKEKLSASLEKLERENEGFRETWDEIKSECEDMASLLVDDKLMNKGDRVFWMTKEGTLSPGRILEMRKKSGQNVPYAVLKLEKKMKLPGEGPFKSERETVIAPVDELLTFKSFFKDIFEEYQQKLWRMLSEGNQNQTPDARHKSMRKQFRESPSRLSMDSSFSNLEGSFSSSHEAINSIPIEALREYRKKTLGEQKEPLKRVAKITRSKTLHSGTCRPRPRAMEMKSRSVSIQRTSPLSESDFSFDSDGSNIKSPSPVLAYHLNFDISELEEETDTGPNEFIAVGERVIWHDTYSKNPQVGEVASILQFTPCAIVKFDKLPNETQVFQYRTVPIDQLFPYDLASPEEKILIAEAYGTLDSFMESHAHLIQDDDIAKEEIADEALYSSNSSVEEISATIHEV